MSRCRILAFSTDLLRHQVCDTYSCDARRLMLLMLEGLHVRRSPELKFTIVFAKLKRTVKKPTTFSQHSQQTIVYTYSDDLMQFEHKDVNRSHLN